MSILRVSLQKPQRSFAPRKINGSGVILTILQIVERFSSPCYDDSSNISLMVVEVIFLLALFVVGLDIRCLRLCSYATCDLATLHFDKIFDLGMPPNSCYTLERFHKYRTISIPAHYSIKDVSGTKETLLRFFDFLVLVVLALERYIT